MNVTILGRPFHRLTSELELMNWHLTYVLDVNINTVVENSHVLSKSDVVIVVSLNILLNHYNLDIFSAIIKNSSPKTKIFLWTQEPFWDATSLNQDFALIFGRKVYFYNVVNGKSFLSIYSHYFGVGGVLWSEKRITNLEVPERDFLKKRFELGQANGHLVSAYATCFHDVRLDLKYSIVRERNDLIYNSFLLCDYFNSSYKLY
ncbi:MAG: hypothetical protein K2Y14_01640 [Burkholderiales bacterium]|nr:hypothetical protein [Burkholderiales bacterium]